MRTVFPGSVCGLCLPAMFANWVGQTQPIGNNIIYLSKALLPIKAALLQGAVMNTKSLLDQLFRSGAEMLQGKSSSQSGYSTSQYSSHSSAQHSQHTTQKQSGSDLSSQLSSLLPGSLAGALSGKAGAALAGGALGLLLGSKSGRKMGGTVLTYGGLAALGALAYKAYQNYQQQQPATAANTGHAAAQPLEQLPAPVQEAHSKAILVALIAAAKADGHIDAKERQLIDGEIAKITHDHSVQQWFDAELQKPLDPAEIARYATDQAMASEMFLASVLVVDEENFMEKSYLQELARQLQLPAELQQSLRAQVAEVQQAMRS